MSDEDIVFILESLDALRPVCTCDAGVWGAPDECGYKEANALIDKMIEVIKNSTSAKAG